MSRARAAALVARAVVLAGATGGCGIRATSVPVDAGAAPTRASCMLPDRGRSNDAVSRMTVRIYLVCGRRLMAVDRSVRDRQLTGGELDRLLLEELTRRPDDTEARNGFASQVPEGLRTSGPFYGDPPGALRLDRDPAELSAHAVGQLVCTLVDARYAPSGPRRPVLLGGPDPKAAPQSYTCDEGSGDPDAGPSAGPAPS